MWWWLQWGLVPALVLNAAGVMVSVRTARRTNHELRQVLVLEQVLTDIVAKSFAMQHRSTWQAWAQEMGPIEVAVTPRRRDVSE